MFVMSLCSALEHMPRTHADSALSRARSTYLLCFSIHMLYHGLGVHGRVGPLLHDLTFSVLAELAHQTANIVTMSHVACHMHVCNRFCFAPAPPNTCTAFNIVACTCGFAACAWCAWAMQVVPRVGRDGKQLRWHGRGGAEGG
jgi:hypothetical protein